MASRDRNQPKVATYPALSRASPQKGGEIKVATYPPLSRGPTLGEEGAEGLGHVALTWAEEEAGGQGRLVLGWLSRDSGAKTCGTPNPDHHVCCHQTLADPPSGLSTSLRGAGVLQFGGVWDQLLGLLRGFATRTVWRFGCMLQIGVEACNASVEKRA